MTLTAIDAFVEHGDARVVVRCDCGETIEIFETLDTERAIDQATELHPCPRCVACGEPMPADDQAYAMLACSPCHRDDAEGTRQAVAEYIATLGPTEVMRRLAEGVAKFDARAEQRKHQTVSA